MMLEGVESGNNNGDWFLRSPASATCLSALSGISFVPLSMT